MPRLIIRKSALSTTHYCRRWINGISARSQRRKTHNECYKDIDHNSIASSNEGEAGARLLIDAGLRVALNVVCWLRRSRCVLLAFLILFFMLSFFKLTYISDDSYNGELPYPDSDGEEEELSANRVLPMAPDINPVNYRLSRPNCSALEAGDEGEIRLVEDMMYKEIRLGIPNRYFRASTTNCSRFRELRSYAQQPYSLYELQTPLAYVIAVKSSAEQVERLLRAVYAPQNVYCLYSLTQSSIDFKRSDLGRAVKLIAGCFSNVFVVSNGNQGRQLDTTPYRASLESLLAYPSWRYALLTSEGDFPLQTNRGIVDSVRQAVATWRSKLTKGQSQHLPPLSIGNDFSGFVLSRQMVSSTMHRLEKQEEVGKAKAQQMSSQSRDAPSFVDLMIRHEDSCPAGMQCVLTSSDLHWLLEQPLIFARRFDLSVDYVVVACIEDRLQRLNSNNQELNALDTVTTSADGVRDN